MKIMAVQTQAIKVINILELRHLVYVAGIRWVPWRSLFAIGVSAYCKSLLN